VNATVSGPGRACHLLARCATPAKVVLDADLAPAAAQDPPDVARMARLVAEARAEDVRSAAK
jgi:hypothetical protein